MKGSDKTKCTRKMTNWIGRLFKIIRDIKGTDTCFFIHRQKVLKYSKVSYSRKLCNIRPQKKETHRVRLTVGDYKLTYDVPVSTPTEDSTTSKLHCNRALSTPDGKYIIVDVNRLYLNNPIKKAKYYKRAIKIIPKDIKEKYEQNNNQRNRYLYVRV